MTDECADVEPVLQGVCGLCGQELLLTIDDCWHPWNVGAPCPGSRFGRPGREHWQANP